MAATGGALDGSQGLSGGWLTAAQSDAITGYPAQETYSGPVSENHLDPGHADPGRSGPPDGTPAPPVPSTGGVPLADLSGGEHGDTQAAVYGSSAPMAAFDSAAGAPFAPSGPAADTHGYDTGGTGRKEHVPVPRSPGWFRLTLRGQTWNRQAQVTDGKGWQLSSPNDRQNLDELQGQNANGYDPFVIPYSERPLKANFAAESYPVSPVSGPYGVAGVPGLDLMGGQGNLGYTSPPDPSVNLQPASAGTYAPSLGSEYLSG
jgi:hypothetical protein